MREVAASLASVMARLIGASELITCWGSGRVNVRRAPQAAMSLGTPLTGVEIAALGLEAFVGMRTLC